MKILPLILSILALIGVSFLLIKGTPTPKPTTVKVKNETTGKDVEVEMSRIAYVDLDTMEAKYKVFGLKKTEFENREKKIQQELKSKAQALEASYMSLQKQAQAGTLTQAEGEKMQKSLIAKQEGLEKLRNDLGTKLMKDQDAFNKELKKKLDETVAEYNKDNRYDYVLSYSKEGSIIHVNTALNITQDIVDLMNDKK